MTSESLANKTIRHLRIAARAHGLTPIETPAYLTLFVTSRCNLQCEHCSVHARLNQPDDLRLSELIKLSEELGQIEALHLTGGEPFMRDDLLAICRQFARQNGVRQLSINTSGYHVERIARSVEQLLSQTTLAQLTIELSLDGTAAFHNQFRGDVRAFDNAIQTYYGLAALQRRDARLRLRVVSTATRENLDEIERLSHYLYERCPQLESHAVNMLEGERRRSTMRAPELGRFLELTRRIQVLWADRERDLKQKLGEPVLRWAKAQALELRQQVVPCKAGVLSAVVHANGDVAVCETDSAHPILGNLRENSFRELWTSPQAQKARTMIRTRQCACANERCLAPSIAYQPAELARAAMKSRLREQPRPLPLETPLAYAAPKHPSVPAAKSSAPSTAPAARAKVRLPRAEM